MRTKVGRSGDPAIRRSGDPAIRRSGDPAIRRSGDPAIRRSGDPAIRRSGDPAIRLIITGASRTLVKPRSRTSPAAAATAAHASRTEPMTVPPDCKKTPDADSPKESARPVSSDWYQTRNTNANRQARRNCIAATHDRRNRPAVTGKPAEPSATRPTLATGSPSRRSRVRLATPPASSARQPAAMPNPVQSIPPS